jgi:5,6-dimethylbenzimidazole synthase
MTNNPNSSFSEQEKAGFYRAIYERRDVRSKFLPDPIPNDVLARLINAAHHAPSVGFMQPWDFIAINSVTVREQVLGIFEQENEKAAGNYQGDRQQTYRSLKLQGILESPMNLCITCDRSRGGTHVLGRSSIVETDLFSTCLAVQNLWLAARAESIGVGWVSILDQEQLAETLGLPEHVYPLAYLCLGYVSEFLDQPELQAKGWRSRLPLNELVHGNGWGQALNDEALREALENSRQR